LTEELEGIHIYNATTSKGTLSDRNGTFEISVSIGDTLHISSIQFEKVSVVISPEHYVTKKVHIELKNITNELDEIFLKNHSLTGDLSKDAKNIKTTAPVTPFSLGIVDREIRVLTQSQRKLKTANSGVLDPIINAISGRTKMLKKRVEADKANMRIENLIEKFPPAYLAEELQIEEGAIYDFLYFCETDPNFIETLTKDRITILHFLKQKAIFYLKFQAEE